MRTGRAAPRLALTIGVGAVYAFMLAPLAVVMLFSVSDRSFLVFPPQGFSLQWYERAWASGQFLKPALLSLEVALLSAGLSSLAAVPAALYLRTLRPGLARTGLEFVLLSPLVVPALITGIGLLYLFSAYGLIDSFAGLAAAHTVIVFPFVLRAVLTSAIALPQHLQDASDSLGASPWQTFRHVIFPGLVPGLASGTLFAFIVSFDQFTVSLFVTQDRQVTLPIAIYKYLYDTNDPVAAAVSTVLILLGLGTALVMLRLGLLNRLLGIE